MAARRTKRSDGRYQASVTYEKADGSKGRHPVYGATQAEVNERVLEVRARLASGGPVKDSSRTVGEWLEEWRTTFLKASDLKPSTKEGYENATRRWVEPAIGHVTLEKLRPVDVVRVMNAMEEAGMAGGTRRNCYAALAGALEDAVRNELLMTNPVRKVKRPSADHTEARSLSPEEVGKFLKGAESLRYVTALKVILLTGLRRGEALALRWEDVDLERQEARVRGSLVRRGGVLVVSEPKTVRSRRVISLSGAAVSLLKAHKAAQAAERLRAANLWSEEGFIFATETGTPADPRNLRRATAIAQKKAGLSGTIGVHTLRHTYATTALLNNVPLHVVSRNLGHSSISITADIYGHLTDEASQSAAETVSAAYGM